MDGDIPKSELLQKIEDYSPYSSGDEEWVKSKAAKILENELKKKLEIDNEELMVVDEALPTIEISDDDEPM